MSEIPRADQEAITASARSGVERHRTERQKRGPEGRAYRRLRNRPEFLALRDEHLARRPCCEPCEAIGVFKLAVTVRHRGVPPTDPIAFMDPGAIRSLCAGHLKADADAAQARACERRAERRAART